jgi:Ca-activated chloride channel family protein
MPRGYGGGTMIGLALRKCIAVLKEREKGDRMIVLVSDGVSFDLSDGQDEKVAQELKDQGVVLYGVHIGGGNVPSEVAAIATITGGTTFSPGDQQALADVFRRIDAMRVAELERTYAELLDFFWPFSYVGTGLLGLFALSLMGLRFTPW